VSVIVPVYNGERYLAEALDSIAPSDPALVEVVAVDDGSTDSSARIVESRSAVRWVAQEHRGLPAARNRGLAAAAGDTIAFLDADDRWTDGKLRRQLDLLDRHPAVDIVLGMTRRMWAAADGLARREPVLGPPELALSFGAALVRRAVFARIGVFDESFTFCDDWDWFMRARELGVTIGVHSDVTLLYRRHDGNMTNDRETGNRFFAKVLRSSLARRRHGGGDALPKLVPLD
jgi:glycosyltransferase involved in cell wall biosynthesis